MTTAAEGATSVTQCLTSSGNYVIYSRTLNTLIYIPDSEYDEATLDLYIQAVAGTNATYAINDVKHKP